MSRIRRSRALVALLVAVVASTAVGIPAVADLNLILGANAQVSYTNGDGVNVRDAVGFGGNVITALGEGVEVLVHDGPVAANDGTYWYYISSGGVEGWVIADYLALPGSQLSGVTSWGQIAYTGGAGVNVRTAASIDSGIIMTLNEGTGVAILAGPEWDAAGYGWTLIEYEGIQGWVSDDFVTRYGQAGEQQRVLDSAWTAYVAKTEGAGLRLRAASSYDAETLVVMPEGSPVLVYDTQIYGSDGTEWWHVEYEGIAGYSVGYYFSDQAPGASNAGESVEVVQPADESAPEESSDDSGLAAWAGANAMVTGTNGAGLNVRYEWGYDAGIATWIPEGEIVYVVEGPVWADDGSPWFQIETNGLVGWVHGGYLVHTESGPAGAEEAEVSSTEAEEAEIDEPEDDSEPAEAASTGDSVGQAIVNEALNYVGLPYVWGGTTPAGFDCSGFVHYVLTRVLGYNFTRALEVQAVSGTHVDPSNLAPGDLVFFQNTYRWGLSHVGIYIGDGQFVHAGSERTGVVISNMWDDYWGSRYYTARRVR